MKYKLLTNDSIRLGDKTLYRIKALKSFGDVKRGDLGGNAVVSDHAFISIKFKKDSFVSKYKEAYYE